jgi:hypothetical protein
MVTSDPIGINAGAGIGVTCAVRTVASICASNTPPKTVVMIFLIFDILILPMKFRTKVGTGCYPFKSNRQALNFPPFPGLPKKRRQNAEQREE